MPSIRRHQQVVAAFVPRFAAIDAAQRADVCSCHGNGSAYSNLYRGMRTTRSATCWCQAAGFMRTLEVRALSRYGTSCVERRILRQISDAKRNVETNFRRTLPPRERLLIYLVRNSPSSLSTKSGSNRHGQLSRLHWPSTRPGRAAFEIRNTRGSKQHSWPTGRSGCGP